LFLNNYNKKRFLGHPVQNPRQSIKFIFALIYIRPAEHVLERSVHRIQRILGLNIYGRRRFMLNLNVQAFLETLTKV